MAHDLLIFGASCRAAAYSALRIGLRPRCADYFADRDLAAVCEVTRVEPEHAERQFTAIADSLPPSPWFYTGGWENHPEWVAHVSRRHMLWGAGADTLRMVRDPFRIAEILHGEGILVPSLRHSGSGLPRDGSWLKKPLRSAGGRGIMPLIGPLPDDRQSHYLQQYIVGESYSALYLGERSQTRMIGVTRQLTGSATLDSFIEETWDPVRSLEIWDRS